MTNYRFDFVHEVPVLKKSWTPIAAIVERIKTPNLQEVQQPDLDANFLSSWGG